MGKMIIIIYNSELRALTETRSESISASHLADVFAHIKEKYGKQAHQKAKRCLVTINAERATGMNAPLTENSIVEFHIICSGG